MKSIAKVLCTLFFGILAISCTKESEDAFTLHYHDAEVSIGGSTLLTPSYLGGKPTNFRIYSITRNDAIFYDPRLDGELQEADSFYISPKDGAFTVQNTSEMSVGIYRISLSCESNGELYEFPNLITVKLLR